MNDTQCLEALRAQYSTDALLSLLHVSIGPVQEFIAESRKTRDLWVGSYLLSLVTYEAMKAVSDHCQAGPDAIVFPRMKDTAFFRAEKGLSRGAEEIQQSSIPNHFLAVVKMGEIKGVTEAVKETVAKYLKDTGQGTCDEIAVGGGTGEGRISVWDFQLEEHFQVAWVGLPVTLEDLSARYSEKFRATGLRLAERKLTRTFAPWQGSTAEKCVQCSHREALGSPDRSQNSAFWLDMRKKFPRDIKDYERLCAVCLLKRLIPEEALFKGLPSHPFPSTVHIASRPFRQALENKPAVADKLFQAYNGLCHELPGQKQSLTISEIYAEWFYEKNLDKEVFLKENRLESLGHGIVDALSVALEALKEVAGPHGLGQKPSAYYTILVMDGDHMGEFLAGGFLDARDGFNLDWQARQSAILAGLARKDFPGQVSAHGGVTVYCGGDDLLALLPLEGAVETMQQIRSRFRQNFNTTISAALLIVHYQEPLQWAIKTARRELERAKEVFNRDSAVLALKVSSGAFTTCGFPWDLHLDLQGTPAIVPVIPEVILKITGWLAKEKNGLSPGFIYDVLAELPAFYTRGHKRKEVQRDMLNPELHRLLGRHIDKESPICRETFTHPSTSEAIPATSLALDALTELGDPSRHIWAADTEENLAAFLKILTFLAREKLWR